MSGCGRESVNDRARGHGYGRGNDRGRVSDRGYGRDPLSGLILGGI